MNKTICDFHQFSASRTIALLEELQTEEWLIQPDGFANNIAWNVGHMLLVRQNLIYRNPGLETGLDKTMGPMYKPVSAPADWESQPDPVTLLNLFKTVTGKLSADFDAGLFNDVNFNGFELGGGTPVTTHEAACVFNLYHEGLHLGNISDIRDVIRQKR